MIPKLKLSNCTVIFFSSIIQAIGIYNIHVQSQVTEGGVLGLTLWLNHWFSISPAVSSLILNTACYLLGHKTLGRSFIGYSLVSIVSYSLGYAFLEQFPPLWPEIAGHPLLAAILGALFLGVGAGLCVRVGGATGGDDALAMSLCHILHIPIERIYLVTDLAVMGLSLTYIPLRRIAYSLLTVVLSSQIIGIIQKIHIHKK